ncbi:unnamed protein product [Dracunculus medinensis]|uniref:Endo/exonuclease/phosphatase domain-containing protein n=1 Tax=Dracunculus medinensis TaxID=318479 RepID=A0A0N4URA5_DRAME|nr:unnamed protein product [Dracunculus medinensis]
MYPPTLCKRGADYSCLERQNIIDVAINIHILSKYRVDAACLQEVRLPHIGSQIIIKHGSEQRYWLSLVMS